MAKAERLKALVEGSETQDEWYRSNFVTHKRLITALNLT